MANSTYSLEKCPTENRKTIKLYLFSRCIFLILSENILFVAETTNI